MIVARGKQRVPLVEQELPTRLEQMSFSRLFIWVCVIQLLDYISSCGNNVWFTFTTDWLVYCTCFMYVLCIYLRIMVLNSIFKPHDVRVFLTVT